MKLKSLIAKAIIIAGTAYSASIIGSTIAQLATSSTLITNFARLIT